MILGKCSKAPAVHILVLEKCNKQEKRVQLLGITSQEKKNYEVDTSIFSGHLILLLFAHK